MENTHTGEVKSDKETRVVFWEEAAVSREFFWAVDGQHGCCEHGAMHLTRFTFSDSKVLQGQVGHLKLRQVQFSIHALFCLDFPLAVSVFWLCCVPLLSVRGQARLGLCLAT